MKSAVPAVLALLGCSAGAWAYYLPGTYPQEFYKGQTLQGALLMFGLGLLVVVQFA